jgi:hypothetical protein
VSQPIRSGSGRFASLKAVQATLAAPANHQGNSGCSRQDARIAASQHRGGTFTGSHAGRLQAALVFDVMVS